MEKNKLIKYKSTFSLTLPALVVVTLAVYGQVGTQNQDGGDVVLDYETYKEKTVSIKRKEKSKTFNSPSKPAFKRPIKEFPPDSNSMRIIHLGRPNRNALPIERSAAILLGIVTDKKVHMSDDETRVYTDYEVKIEKVYKDFSESLRPGSVTTFARLGGDVRFKSGRVQKYKVAGNGVVKKGRRYLLFVKNLNFEDLDILTAYEFSDRKVTAVDEKYHDRPTPNPYLKYDNADQTKLLLDLKIALHDDEPTIVKLGKPTKKEKAYSKRYSGYGSPRNKLSNSIRLMKERGMKKGEIGRATLPEINYGLLQLPVPKLFGLLVCTSDAIVFGSPSNKKSHLTEDEGWVYTEYEFLVKEILKDNRDAPIKKNSSIQIARTGGLVKVDSIVFRVKNYEIPQLKKNNDYILLLSYVPDAKGYIADRYFGDFVLKDNRFVSVTNVSLPKKLRTENEYQSIFDTFRIAVKDSCKPSAKAGN